MKRIFASVCLAMTVAAPAISYAANNDPIVLVHGFAGWGRDEVFGYKHWGGTLDIQEYLKGEGHPTVTVAVGPTSSNWDRAVEAYAQLKGGCVDYGAAHAAKHGHARYGRCYSPLLTQWDDTHRVHLISHSQGAQTSNTLIELLRNGSAEERAATGNGTSELFKGGKNWIRSATTVAGANNGTTFGKLTSFNDFAKELLKGVASFLGATGSAEDLPYDFKLDQWGLVRQSGESQHSYWDRVMASPIWKSKDVALYDLGPDGAAELNAWVKTSPEVYYFSWTNSTTYKGPLTDNHYPLPSTNLILTPFATGMGVYNGYGPAWHENDGVVTTNSMKAPFGAPVVDYNGTAQKGKWNYLGHMTGDHWDVIGSGDFIDNLGPNNFLRNLYLTQAQRLKGL